MWMQQIFDQVHQDSARFYEEKEECDGLLFEDRHRGDSQDRP